MADKRRAELDQVMGEVKANDAKVQEIFDAADKEGRAETSDEIKAIEGLNKASEKLLVRSEEIKALLGIQTAMAGRADAREPAGGHGHGTPGHDRNQGVIKSFGQLFLDDPEVKGFLDTLGPVSKGRKIDSPRLEVKSFLKTLITGAGATSAGAFVFPDFKPIVDEFYKRPLTVRDLITIGETGSDTVEYVRVTGVTNNAAVVPEADSSSSADDTGRKPESAMTFVRKSETVKTIAHWIPVSNRALQDAGQLRSYIDSFLQYGIQQELEDQILQGDGEGDNFLGILNDPDRGFQPFSTDILKTARKARTKVRVNGRAMPTAYIMHPVDWETIDLTTDDNGRYYFGGPMAMGQKTLWGLPVIESEACTQGEALVGDFKLAILWDRMQSLISVSNSHNDFFVKNLVAILAEMRAAFGVIRPQAFCQFETVSGGS